MKRTRLLRHLFFNLRHFQAGLDMTPEISAPKKKSLIRIGSREMLIKKSDC